MNDWLAKLSPGVVFMWAVCGFAISLMVLVIIFLILLMFGYTP